MDINNSKLWYEAIKDEMNSIIVNQVWDLVKLPNGWILLVVNEFSKPKKIHSDTLNDTRQESWLKDSNRKNKLIIERLFFCLKKDSFCIIMILVEHFIFELYQMDIKITFINRDLEEQAYIKQLEGFY